MSHLTCKPRCLLLSTVLLAVAWSSASVAQPLDLLDTWRLALNHDPEYRAEQAAAQAGGEQRNLARSLWLPSIDASATAGHAGHTSSTQGAQFITPDMTSEDVEFNTSIRGGNMSSYGLGIKQPLLNRARLAESRQLRLSAEVADLQWQSAQQNLMLKVAQRYFAVVLARGKVSFLTQQQNQVELIQQETQERFKLGDRPVTDTYEAFSQCSRFTGSSAGGTDARRVSRGRFY